MGKALYLALFFCAYVATGVSGTDASATDSGNDVARKIHDNCRQCVFTVNAYSRISADSATALKNSGKEYKWQRNIGTAIPIDNEGHLITLNSVVKGAEKIKIITHDGETIRAGLLGSDMTGRIAVLKIDESYIPHVPNATTAQKIVTGEKVYFLGVVPGMSVDINTGTITGVNLADGSIEVKTVKTPGTSGTPVFDNNENVIGILAYQVDPNGVKPKEATYLVFSLEHATLLSKQVISATRPKCGWLGVCVDLTVAGDDGVVIENIIEGSPAHASSLKPKDRILEFNGQPIRNVRDFSDAFIKTKAGETISIKIVRNNQPMTVGVTLKGR